MRRLPDLQVIAGEEGFPSNIKTEAVPYLGTAFFVAIVSHLLIFSLSSPGSTPVLSEKYWSTSWRGL